MKEILHIKVVIEKKFSGVLHARLCSQVGVSTFAKLWNEIYGHVAMVERYNGSHRTAVTSPGPSQNIHASDRVGNSLLTVRHIRLRDDIESLDICEVEWELGFQGPYGMEDQLNLPDKETYQRYG
jgi:hypothetical protein